MRKIICLLMTAMLCVTAFVGCGISGDKSSSKIEPSVKIVEDNEGFWNFRKGMSLEECVNILGDYSEKNDKSGIYYWYFDEVNSFKTLENETITPLKNKEGYCACVEVDFPFDEISTFSYKFNYVGMNNAAAIASKLAAGEEYIRESRNYEMITRVKNHSLFKTTVEIINNVSQNSPTVLVGAE